MRDSRYAEIYLDRGGRTICVSLRADTDKEIFEKLHAALIELGYPVERKSNG